jgi:hypothetical protein
MSQAKFQAMAEYYKSLYIFDDSDNEHSNKPHTPDPCPSPKSLSSKSNSQPKDAASRQSVESSSRSKKSEKTSSADPFDGYFEVLVGDKKKADFLKKVEPSDSGGKFDHLFPDGLDDLEGL